MVPESTLSVELTSMVCASVVALLGFLSAYRAERGRRRRLALAVAFAFSIIAALASLDEFVRQRTLAELPQELEREWVVLRETPVDRIEVEMLAPDGRPLPGLAYYARNTTLQITGLNLGANSVFKGAPVILSDILTQSNVESAGRLGELVLAVKTTPPRDGTSKPANRIDDAHCFASHFTTGDIIRGSHGNFASALDASCAAIAAIPVPEGRLTLASIARWPAVSLTETLPDRARCLGMCKEPVLVGVRLVLHHNDGLGYTRIEISPALLLQDPSRVSDDGRTGTFKLSGEALLELAKSYYFQSVRYRNLGSFMFTKGLVGVLYTWLTKASSTVELVDTVWTTDPHPDEAALLGAVAPLDRKNAAAYGLGEWCGFGSRDLCWYRFLVTRPVTESHAPSDDSGRPQ